MSVSASQSLLHADSVQVFDSAVRLCITLSVEALVNVSFCGASSYYLIRPKQKLGECVSAEEERYQANRYSAFQDAEGYLQQ